MSLYNKLKTGRHRVVDTPVARYLRRKTGDPNIFSFYDRRYGSWTVATWINKSSKVCYEHFGWDGTPHDVSAAKVRGMMITKSDAYRAFLKEKVVMARLYEKHDEDEAIGWAEEQEALFSYARRKARHSDGHPMWWNFPKQGRVTH